MLTPATPYKNIQIASEVFINEMLQQKTLYVTGNNVDMVVLNKWQQYWASQPLTELKSDDQKLAFWINIYNGVTIFFIIQLQLKVHMREDLHFFDGYFLQFHQYELSLDAIEHGILRKNKDVHFDNDAAFLALQVHQFNYQIHFALNCGGLSCPSIHVYQANTIQQQLQTVTTQFVTDNFLIDDEHQTITCNAIFNWYKNDFENKYLNDSLYKNYRINIIDYNWNF